jgi:hypothetical protein
MTPDDTPATTWFGDFTMAPGETRRWRMGPKTLWISRARNEWQVTAREGTDPLAQGLEVAQPDEMPHGHGLQLARFVAPEGDGFRILPALPDRPVIVRAAEPVLILPGSKVSIYISCPLWVQLWLTGSTVPAVDAPIYRPSDTWFGSNTMDGEMCYASRTSARQSMSELPVRHHRAILQVRIRNTSSTALELQRLRLPVPQLSLFVAPDGSLWTERLNFERAEDTSGAQAVLSNQPPIGVDVTRLTPPRQPMRRSFLVDAFGGLWKGSDATP